MILIIEIAANIYLVLAVYVSLYVQYFFRWYLRL